MRRVLALVVLLLALAGPLSAQTIITGGGSGGVSGLTSNVVTIEHSVDGVSSWATLVTFATVTGVTSERVAVAAGTTVRRFLRVVDTLTGTPIYTRSVSFARR